LLLSFLVSFSVVAQAGPKGEGECCQERVLGGGWMLEKPFCAQMAKELKLSAEQTRKIEGEAQKAREASQPLKGVLEEAHKALQQALAQPSLNEEEIIAKLSAVSAAKLELQKSHMKFLLAVRKELSPEQWEKLRDKKMHKGKRGKWRHAGTCKEGDCPAAKTK